MKREIYDRMLRMGKINRRNVLRIDDALFQQTSAEFQLA